MLAAVQLWRVAKEEWGGTDRCFTNVLEQGEEEEHEDEDLPSEVQSVVAGLKLLFLGIEFFAHENYTNYITRIIFYIRIILCYILVVIFTSNCVLPEFL